MKVRELIKDTIWTPGFAYDLAHKPAISVLLPTFRRGKSGLFRKAVRSVLDQTLQDIELIIVDDASTDGTADQIAEFMELDGRVSCLRHPNNIGLPAISEYEAYVRARGNYIAFAFDDDFFYSDALERLFEASKNNPGKVCYGSIIWRRCIGNDQQEIRLGQHLSSYNLNGGNCISNNAVLLPRAVIEDVGLYDPHILLTRLCDWDLWRRINRNYLLHYVDLDIGEVTGPETNDSLGNTYALTQHATSEWMRRDRPLGIETFPDLDVFEISDDLSKITRRTVSDLMLDHISTRPLFSHSPRENVEKNVSNKSIIVLCSHYDASTALYFEFLPAAIRSTVRIVHTLGGYPLTEIAYASCIVVVRNLAIHAPWIAAAKQLKIPLYYFLDDNLPELVAKEGMAFDGAHDFDLQSLRAHLKDFSAVLLSTEPLKEYFAAHLLHDNLHFYPISYAQAPPRLSAAPFKETVIASLGGGHRIKGMTESVMPALKRLASADRPIHFVVGGASDSDTSVLEAASRDNGHLRVTTIPFEMDWTRAILQIGQYRPSFLIHAPSKTVNQKYKTVNAALCAYAIDAVLVVGDEPPFDGMNFKDTACLVEPPQEPRAWLQALEKLISDPEGCQNFRNANALYCRMHFSGETNIELLNRMLQSAPPVTSTRIENRLKDLFSARVNTVGGQLINVEPLRRVLSELSLLRMKRRVLHRLKPRALRSDIWPNVTPAFEGIRQHVINNGIRKPGRYLELSSSISAVPFVPYHLLLNRGTLETLTCAFASDGLHDGRIGIELVSPEGSIVHQTSKEAHNLDFDVPVVFDLGNVQVAEQGMWEIRFFAHSQWPIYIYEFAEYSWLGLERKGVAPFISITYATAVSPSVRTISPSKSANVG